MSSARSRANLRPWPKGVSGNPGGKPKLPDELRAVRELTSEELRRVIGKYARMPASEVETIAKDRIGTSLDVAVAASFKSAFEGFHAQFSFLLDRSIGKPVEAQEEREDDDEGFATVEEARKILADDFVVQPDEKVEVPDL